MAFVSEARNELLQRRRHNGVDVTDIVCNNTVDNIVAVLTVQYASSARAVAAACADAAAIRRGSASANRAG